MSHGVFSIPLPALAGGAELAGSSGCRPRCGPPAELIVGPENRLARVAVDTFLLPAPSPAAFYPLVIYGPPGCGKSHLTSGLAAIWKERYPQASVYHLADAGDVPAGHLLYDTQVHDHQVQGKPHDMVEHSSSTRVAGQTAWQSTTLVILENLHQLSRQRSAQRQLASLIDRLERVGGKLIVTSQTAPAACEQLSPMLSSRLNAGLVINLLAPQAAARRALVRSQARHRGIPLTEGAVSQLAARLASCSVAELLRTMDRLAASEGSASTEPAALDEAVVRRFFHLDPQAARPPVPLPLGRIFRLVARQYSVTTADLRGRSRRRSVALARSMAMYVASRYARYSLKKIGTSLGKRDHTTVMHGCQNIEKLLHTDANCRQALQQIVAEIEAESAPIPLPEPSIPRPGGP